MQAVAVAVIVALAAVYATWKLMPRASARVSRPAWSAGRAGEGACPRTMRRSCRGA